MGTVLTANGTTAQGAAPIAASGFVPVIVEDEDNYGVVLPRSVQGSAIGPGVAGRAPATVELFVLSDSAVAARVYPLGSDTAPVITLVRPGRGVRFTAISEGSWLSEPMAMV